MNISKFFIQRPIFATVLSIIIMLVGAMAMRILPIAQYPDVVPPSVSITATYPGADAETVAETVAAPLAQQINGVENMLYMTSTSTDSGTMQMNVSFAVGSDGNMDTINVNNRVQQALASLPSEVQAQGVQVNLKSGSMLMLVALTSPNGAYDRTYLQNYAAINLTDPLKQISGVGDAAVLGNSEFAMRIWLDPSKLAQYGLSPTEVKSAITYQNKAVPAGNLAASPQGSASPYTYTVSAGGRFNSADQFRSIILRTNSDGSTLRLGDVARIELGSSSYAVLSKMNGAGMAPITIQQQPGSNAVSTVNAVKVKMAELAEHFPEGMSYSIPYDTTQFINASIESVIHTFVEALLLVAVIVFIFLQNWRVMVIAMSVVPIAVIGTFAGMYALDFSINLLSLFGMILAIGIVVDDAILVVENVERLMTEDKTLSIFRATVEAMREVSGPVVATAFIMASVFVPVGFLGGLTGMMYKQFAVTIAISVAISAVVALTLTPALCVLLIRHVSEEKGNAIARVLRTPLDLFNKVFDKVTHLYMFLVRAAIRMWLASLLILVAVSVSAVWIYERNPSTLVPSTDQGMIMAPVMLPSASSLTRTEQYMDKVAAILRQDPSIQYVTEIVGYDLTTSSTNTARGAFFITLKPWSERSVTSTQMLGKIMGAGQQVQGGMVFAVNMPPIIGLSSMGGFSGYLQPYNGASSKELYQASLKVMQAAAKRPELAGVRTSFDVNVPSYRLNIDQEKATAYGIELSTIQNTLSGTLGNSFVNFFTYQNRNYRVYVQNDGDYRRSPEDLNRIYVSSNSGKLVPLSEVASLERTTAPSNVTRINVSSGALFQGSSAPGYSSIDALNAMNEVVTDTLGRNWGMSWTDTSYQETHAGSAASLAIVFGLVMVFLILAAQYESWAMPLAVMTSVPFAFLGAVVAIWLRGLEVSVYVQIGFLVVVGLAAKNAIMIVEFAELLRKERGLSIREAAIEAAHLRFRPIIMTSLAFIFGTLPLMMASGAGDTNSHHIGTTVVGGMLCVMLLASVFVPAFYSMIASTQHRLWGDRKSAHEQFDEDDASDAISLDKH